MEVEAEAEAEALPDSQDSWEADAIAAAEAAERARFGGSVSGAPPDSQATIVDEPMPAAAAESLPLWRAVRGCVVAPAGRALLSIRLPEIALRLLAHHAGGGEAERRRVRPRRQSAFIKRTAACRCGRRRHERRRRRRRPG